MRVAAYGVIACTTLLALDLPAPFPTPTVQGGVCTILATLVVYLVTKVLPSYRTEMQDERMRSEKAVKKRDKKFCKAISRLSNAVVTLAESQVDNAET